MAGRVTHYGNIVRDGLVLHLDAAKKDSYPGSGTTWRDLSGNGNNGTLTNGPTFSGANGGSISFDGFNDIASLGTGLDFNYDNFTVAVWAKSPTNNSGSAGYPIHVTNLIGKGSWNATASWRIGYRSSGGLPATEISFTYGISWFSSDIGINVNTYDLSQWNYFVGVATPTQQSIYLNGVLRGTLNTSKVNVSNEFDLQMGRSSYIDRFFSGNVSNASIYNRALSATEITQNFNALRGRYGI
jgi:hypothetical protein